MWQYVVESSQTPPKLALCHPCANLTRNKVVETSIYRKCARCGKPTNAIVP